MKHLLFCLLLALPASASDRTILEHARQIAETSALVDSECAPPMRTYFDYRRKGGENFAEAALVLPIGLDEAQKLIGDVADYPEWVLVRPDGSPNLHSLVFDSRTGKGEVKVADAANMTLRGILTHEQQGPATGLCLEMIPDGQLRQARLEIAAFPRPECDGSTLVTLSMSWKIGWLARWFVGKAGQMPALFLLAIRDDLASTSLNSAETLTAVLGTPVEEVEGRCRLAGLPPGGEEAQVWPRVGDAILRLEPAGVRVGDRDRWKIDALAAASNATKINAQDIFSTFLAAMSGRHEIAAFDIRLERPDLEGGILIGEDRDLGYRIEFEADKHGGNLSFHLLE